MGFGILLIGYVFFLNTIVPVYTIPVSALVCLFGLRKLKVWNSGIRGAFRVDLLLIVYGLVAAGLAGANAAGATIPDLLTSAVSAGLCLLVLLFHFYLGSGMISLSNEVGLPRLSGRAFFFRTVACIYWLLYAFFNLDLGEKLDRFLARMFVPMTVVGFVVALIGFAVLFSCYTDIVLPDEGKEPASPRKSGERHTEEDSKNHD